MKFMTFEDIRLVELPSPDSRYPDLFAGVGEIGAELAERLLKFNTRNRGIKPTRVAALKRTMAAHQWMLNGDTVVFAEVDGVPLLLDGQHRLQAAAEQGDGDTYALIIVYGVEHESQTTIDQGTKRTAAEQLAIAGIEADNAIAATIRLLIRWHEGMLFDITRVNKMRANTTDIVEWAQLNPAGMAQLREYSAAGYRRIPGSRPAVSMAAAYMFGTIDPGLMTDMFSGLISPVGLVRDSPILALRQYFEDIHYRHVNVIEREMLGRFILAWNALRDGRPMTKLPRPRGGTFTAGSFPVPQ